MLGVLLALLAAILYGSATAIQKYSLTKMKKFSVKKILKDWKWLSSIVVTAVGGLFYIFALKVENLSVVQPILALTIVVPIICGVLFFKEKLKVREWICVFVLVIGIALVSLF